MKYVNLAIWTLIVLCLVGCGASSSSKDPIGYYSYASYDEYTASSSADYSATDKSIYVEGKLSKFDFYTFDGTEYLVAYIEEDTGKQWMWKIGQAGVTSDEALTKAIGTTVRCFGKYMKKE